MKLLVSTPAFGSQVYTPYVSSLISTMKQAEIDGLVESWQIHFQADSLIHRARDRAADYFIRGEFDRLLTIDADISWTYGDLKRVLRKDKDIIGGIYPLKAFPIVMNFNPLQGHGRELMKSERGIDYDALKEFKMKYADAEGLAPVHNLATGFLSVSRKVFIALREKSPIYGTLDAVTGERKGFCHFYSSGVHEGELESEDWSFCRRAREAGFTIFLDTNVILSHTGAHTYRLGQHFWAVQPD